MTRPRRQRRGNAQIGRIAAELKSRAETGLWEGRLITPYFQRCRWQSLLLGLIAIYTRDVGYHTSGWWKNPDYERCWHLSLSFRDPKTAEARSKDKTVTALLIEAIFGKHKRWLWCEPPFSERAKQIDVWHYRLFCDPAWEPIKPHGEVYSRELTEAGWKSFSDVQAEKREQAIVAQESSLGGSDDSHSRK